MFQKTLLIITATLLFSLCFTGQSQYPVPINKNIPINIQIIVDKGGASDHATDNLVKGYILKALREIPDVKIVEDDAMYQIRFFLASAGVPNYTVLYVITSPLKFGLISPFISPENQKAVKGLLKTGHGACHVENYGIFQAAGYDLEEKSKSFIVTLDAGIFQTLRELRQKHLK